MKKAKYIYCVAPLEHERDFGPIGVGGEHVHTINCDGLACVVSDTAEEEYSLADELHLKAHEIVLETVMNECEIVPVHFGTVAHNIKSVKQFLKIHHKDLIRVLEKIKNNVEIEIEIFWKNMKVVFGEIVQGSKRLQALRNSNKQKKHDELIMAGQMVAAQLQRKKEKEGLKYIKHLKGTYVEHLVNPTRRDELLFYGSFLVDKDKLTEFEQSVDALEKENRARIRVRYIGPMPPYSFVKFRMRS